MATFHPTDDDVGQSIAVEVTNREFPSDAGLIVGTVRDPVDTAWGSLEFEPIDDSPCVPHRTRLVMRPIRLAGDNVFKTVAVHVLEVERVQFRKEDAVRILFRLFSHDQVFGETDLISLPHLFEPRQPERM